MSAFSVSDHHRVSNSVPFSLWSVKKKKENHFSSDPSPTSEKRKAGNLFANIDTSVASSLHSRSLSSDHHMMSLNIVMKIIRPWNCDGSPILVMNSWTLLMSCNMVNPEKIFHSNSIGSPSIVSKVLYCAEF